MEDVLFDDVYCRPLCTHRWRGSRQAARAREGSRATNVSTVGAVRHRWCALPAHFSCWQPPWWWSTRTCSSWSAGCRLWRWWRTGSRRCGPLGTLLGRRASSSSPLGNTCKDATKMFIFFSQRTPQIRIKFAFPLRIFLIASSMRIQTKFLIDLKLLLLKDFILYFFIYKITDKSLFYYLICIIPCN